MRRVAWGTAVAAVCLVAGCRVEVDEGEIYQRFLDQHTKGWRKDQLVVHRVSQIHHVDARGTRERLWKRARKALLSLDRDTFDDFWEKNQEQQDLTGRIKSRNAVRYVDDERLAALRGIPGKTFFDAFYDAYPDAPGIMRLSRIGTRRDGKQALVYLGRSFGNLGGYGGYWLLEWHDGRWWLVDRYGRWVS